MGLPASWRRFAPMGLAFSFGLTGAILFVDRTIAGFVQCASAGSCPW